MERGYSSKEGPQEELRPQWLLSQRINPATFFPKRLLFQRINPAIDTKRLLSKRIIPAMGTKGLLSQRINPVLAISSHPQAYSSVAQTSKWCGCARSPQVTIILARPRGPQKKMLLSKRINPAIGTKNIHDSICAMRHQHSLQEQEMQEHPKKGKEQPSALSLRQEPCAGCQRN